MADITIRVSDRQLRIATITVFGAITLCLFLYLNASGIFIPSYRVSVYVPEVGGLTVGSPVLLDGVPVGALDAVKLAGASANAQRRIELVLRIRKRYQNEIRTDSVATTRIEGFLGNPLISIQRGFSGAAIGAGEEIPFIQGPQLPATAFASLLTKITDCAGQGKQSPQGASR